MLIKVTRYQRYTSKFLHPPQVRGVLRYREVQIHFPVDASYFLVHFLFRCGLAEAKTGVSDGSLGCTVGIKLLVGTICVSGFCMAHFGTPLKHTLLGGLPGPLFEGVIFCITGVGDIGLSMPVCRGGMS